VPKASTRGRAALAHPHAVAATDLALAVLGAFSLERPEWTVAELAEALGVYRSRVHRAVATLISRDFLQRDERGKLRLGLKLFELGQVVAENMNLLRDAAAPLKALSEETEASVWLVQRVGDELLDLLKYEPEVPLLVARRAGARYPITFGVAGKVYLAHLPEEEVTRLLAAQPLRRYTDRSIVDPDAYRAELARTRERGYALTRDEVYPGVMAVSAPIWDHRGTLVAAIIVSAPSQQVPPEREAALATALLRTAADISRRLGAGAGRPPRLGPGLVPAQRPRGGQAGA
jgi:DNA-binding IclR family transcriptional regulator